MKAHAWLVLALAACNRTADPRPEWLLTVGTDAPVPQLGDRLLVEVLDQTGVACSGCRRELAVDATSWPLSLGIPATTDPTRVRVRLYRATIAGVSGPSSNRHLDALVHLPATTTLTHVSVALEMRCFGVLADVDHDTTCDPATGTAAAAPVASIGTTVPAVGSWLGAALASCNAADDPDMACVPGGTFLLGGPSYLPRGTPDPVPEQLVRVSPFLLDRDELTVGQMRQLVASQAVPAPQAQDAFSHADCTFMPQANENDALPVNCVSHAAAEAACVALGKRLPTEAEWEWAAGNLRDETDVPWGAFDDVASVCAQSLVARQTVGVTGQSDSCRVQGDLPGLQPGGNPLDATALGILNLAGSVAEWTSGAFVPYADSTCWGEGLMLHVDPTCAVPGARSVRGGSWLSAPAFARVVYRDSAAPESESIGTGFRCARSVP